MRDLLYSFCPKQVKGVFVYMQLEEKKITVLSIIVEDKNSVDSLNALLSEYSEYVVGRMGVPYREKGVSVICIVLDIPMPKANALTGKIGKLSGVTAKTLTSKV